MSYSAVRSLQPIKIVCLYTHATAITVLKVSSISRPSSILQESLTGLYRFEGIQSQRPG